MRDATFEPRSFKSQLTFWFGGLSLLVLLLAGFYLGRLVVQDLTQAQGAALQGLARAAATQLSNSLRERELELLMLSQAPHMQRGQWDDPDVANSLERRQRLRPEYAWLGVTDRTGRVQQATQGFLQGQDVSHRTWFQAGRHGLYVGDVHEAQLLAQLITHPVADGTTLRFIDIAAPVQNGAHLVGVVAAHIHWDWVWQSAQRVLEERHLEDGVELLLLDREGRVLYPLRLAGARATDLAPGPDSAHATDAPARLLAWNDGGDHLTASATLPPTASTVLGWQVVLRQPEQRALADAWALRQHLLWLGLATAALFAFVAYRMAVHIARPLEQLTEAAHRIETRKASPQFPSDLDILEVERLSRSLQSMTHTLLAHEQELEAKVTERTEALQQANAELERRATTDPLTGVFNRRRLEERLDELMQIRQRTGRGFALLVLDIDHFKRINDGHSHDVGDQVLQAFAQVLRQATRVTDFVARFGGEEFVVLLPEDPSPEDAHTVAEKIRQAVADTGFPVVGAVTVSIGLSLLRPDDTQAKDVLLRADAALYAAKAQGRNRVGVR
ncbi:sensor domain-containing diguanylate cyclase [Aquabacterium sp. A08]|uniref:sensor domain-containing diguanylate cyclase n=1 Tax=Aquabacterium sp. A08 TaxID=2718532 RepID=UPI00141F5488|nr:sensor domain-containing diguanylate cyclase [Aquabacterium sp. A08]NIC41215.1 diguanylate cyclase [Aquabacterium sp. A08]